MKKIGVFNIIILTFYSSLFFSCKNEIENVIEGVWSIDTISFDNYKNFNYCLNGNLMRFSANECEFPSTGNNCPNIITTYSKNGEWAYLRQEGEQLYLIISSKNEIFDGKHTLRFLKDEKNKLLKMELTSDDAYIVARKGLYSYEMNLNTINKLVRISKSN